MVSFAVIAARKWNKKKSLCQINLMLKSSIVKSFSFFLNDHKEERITSEIKKRC